MLQSSGLGNSLNAITSLLIPYQIPVLMVISMRGDVGEWNSAQVPMGRSLPAILDAIGIPHSRVESAEDAAKTVQVAGETAFGTRMLHAVLLPRTITSRTQVRLESD
jgi:sulfopyruvate decarboxylase subunit alpha